MPYPLRLACLLLFLLGLTGCARHEGALYNAPPEPGLADALDDTMHGMVEAFPDLTDRGPMIMASFIDVDGTGRASPFDRIAAELSAAALAREGMQVREVLLEGRQLLEVSGSDGLLTRQVRRLGSREGARTLLIGTYAQGHDRLYLALRVVELRTDRVLGSSSLSLALDGNLRELLRAR
ncbi:FlgO family outer membrane protein [Halomonas sp. LR5S13]|uniref:FlgO family outer membrane protein n=1 Tax=Halomonas rhizosphaerae TaxID=3043296 RepID=UPI0024A85160|nr:FlgO family outer membrane protein [Halomonas rhizosphaerae]MDI5922774.1 FlgO family outer membrane protein [Halomonas rhizosphaerae]